MEFDLEQKLINMIKNKYDKKKAVKYIPKSPEADCVGKYTYCGNHCKVYDRTKISSFVPVAENVYIGSSEHPLDKMSTSPYFSILPCLKEIKNSQPIITSCIIGNDVWVGDNIFIKGWVTIGDEAVVTKDVPPSAVEGGVPSKVLKYRFDEQIIQNFLELK